MSQLYILELYEVVCKYVFKSVHKLSERGFIICERARPFTQSLKVLKTDRDPVKYLDTNSSCKNVWLLLPNAYSQYQNIKTSGNCKQTF